jgi:hypothetical protein
VPEGFSVAAMQDSIPMDWWSLFGDTTLNALVEEALRNNQDLAAAAARVEQSRAIAGVAKAALYPEINAQGSGSRTQLPDNTAVQRDNPVNFFNLLGTISYELDFWGKLRNANKAARNQMLATEEGRRNVELSLISDVIITYFDLLSQDRQLDISRSTIASRQESVRLQRCAMMPAPSRNSTCAGQPSWPPPRPRCPCSSARCARPRIAWRCCWVVSGDRWRAARTANRSMPFARPRFPWDCRPN